MAAASAHDLGERAELDLSRVFLERAIEAEANGELIAGGVLLREAVRQHLYALAARHRVLPKRTWTHNSPRILANRIRQAELIDAGEHALLGGMIHVGNQAAHCNPLERDALRDAIDLLQRFIESRALSRGEP